MLLKRFGKIEHKESAMTGKIIILGLLLLSFCFIGMGYLSDQAVIRYSNTLVQVITSDFTDYPKEIDEAYKKTANFGQKRVHVSGPIDDIVVANINNDKFSDVAILDYSNKKVKVLLGADNLQFKEPIEKKFDDMYDLFAGVADFNGDKKIDLAVANDSDDKHFSVFLQKGAGKLKKPKHISADDSSTYNFYYAKTLDFNGDGKPDILGLRGDDVLFACRNVGRGKFKVNKLDDKVGDDGLITGDFDGDGYDDFIVADSIKDKIYFFKSKGTGSFTQTKSNNVSDLGSELYAADINQDGNLDLVGAGSWSGKAWTFFGKGNGTFKKKKTLSDSRYFKYGACITDFDGDKKPDIAAAESSGIYYFPAKGKGNFDKPSIMGNGLNFTRNGSYNGANNIGFGNFNNDNKPDIVGAQYYGTTSKPNCSLVFFRNGGKPASLNISNLQIASKSFILMFVYVKGTVDFSGSGIDFRYNPNGEDSRDSAFLTINVDVGSWPFGFSVTAWATGNFMHKPGSQSGTISFDLVIPTSSFIIGTISVTVDWIELTDYNLVQSNRID